MGIYNLNGFIGVPEYWSIEKSKPLPLSAFNFSEIPHHSSAPTLQDIYIKT
jgi:hypothetical protein